MDAAMTLYRLSWESVSAIQYPQFYDFRTERVRRGIDPATVPDEFWHETAVETTSPWEQRNGLHQLIREGELIRNVRLAKAVVTTSEWEPVEPVASEPRHAPDCSYPHGACSCGRRPDQDRPV